MYPIMGYNSVYADIYFNIERKAITMAIRTASTTARSSSHSTQSAPKKPSSAQRSGSASRSSAPTQSKQTSSAPKRDTFTRSTPTAKQSSSKTSATSTAKTSTASKSSQAKTSTAKSNTTAKASSSKTAAKTKSAQTASKTKRDSFEFSSEAVKKSVQSAKNSKSSANSKAATKSSTKKSANAQTKKTAKNNSTSKGTKGSSKGKTKSAQSKIPEGLKQHLQHTNDPKQKAGMRKTAEDYAAGKVVDQVSQKLKELGIDLTTLTFMSDGSKYGAKIIENGQSYEIVPEGDIRLHERGYMTEQDYDKILYIVAHEVGSESINSTEKFATASALINQLEQYWGNGDTIADGLDNFYNYNSCRDDGGIPNIPHEQCIYSREEDSNALKNNVKPEVDLALQGIRAFDKEIQSWLTLDGLHEKYGTNFDVGGKYIINRK